MADIGYKKFVEFQTLEIWSSGSTPSICYTVHPTLVRERGQVWILLETQLTVNNNPLHPRSPPRRKEKLTDGSITHTTRPLNSSRPRVSVERRSRGIFQSTPSPVGVDVEQERTSSWGCNTGWNTTSSFCFLPPSNNEHCTGQFCGTNNRNCVCDSGVRASLCGQTLFFSCPVGVWFGKYTWRVIYTLWTLK
jgi:hypothetical protein